MSRTSIDSHPGAPCVTVLAAAALLVGLAGCSAGSGKDPLGLWLTPAGHQVLIFRCEPGLCARLAKLSPSFERSSPDPSRREGRRSLTAGVSIFAHLPSDGKGSWTGRMYYPEGDAWFEGSVTLTGNSLLLSATDKAGNKRERSWTRVP